MGSGSLTDVEPAFGPGDGSPKRTIAVCYHSPSNPFPFYLPGPASTSTPWLPTQHSAAALGRSCLPTKVLSLIQAGFLLSQCLTPQKSWLTCSHANPAPPQHTVWVLPYTWQSSVF